MSKQILDRNKKAEIMVFRPRDLMIDEPNYERETELAVIGNHDGETYQIYKHGALWKRDKGKLILGVEGEPLTASISTTDETRWVSIKQWLEEIWTVEVVAKLPPQLLAPLEAKWYAQVTVVPTDIEEAAVKPLSKLKANLMLRDSNLQQAYELGKHTMEESKVQNLIEFAIHALLGGFAMYFAVKQGII